MPDKPRRWWKVLAALATIGALVGTAGGQFASARTGASRAAFVDDGDPQNHNQVLL